MHRVIIVLAALVLVWPGKAVYAGDPWLRVLPGADRLAEPSGVPPVREAFRGDTSLGFVFSSAQVASTTGYGGKPLDILIGIDREMRITGVEILEENEPILSTGRTREDLDAFVGQFAGRDVRAGIDLVSEDGEAVQPGLDAISGATITSLILADAILSTSREVARSVGLMSSEGIDLDSFEALGWSDLLDRGLVVWRQIDVGEVQKALELEGGRLFPPAMGEIDPTSRLIDLFAALATPAMTGRNLLGSERHDRWRAAHSAGAQAIWIGGAGRYSFKGTSWRRDGVFNRLKIVQDGRMFPLNASMHEALADTEAPDLREQALFTLPAKSGFRPDRPFAVELVVADISDPKIEVSFTLPVALPEDFILGEPTSMPVWLRVWSERWLDIAVLVTALLLLTTMLVFEDVIARRPGIWRGVRACFLIFTLVWLGGYAAAQLSIVHVLTFANALRGNFFWEQFLIEPLIFILWSFVAVALVLWGRGVFCGWLCPFGALQELLWAVARKLRLPSVTIPFAIHERLRAIKFLVFLGLLAVSLGSMTQAYELAEVEPFKTVIVLRFDHATMFVVYALLILTVSLFIQRVFCRYLCPLGASLALPARLKQFDWLKRRWQCGQRCHTCAVTCPVQAIQTSGEIHPGECIYCLRCQINYFDDGVCPPLIERRRRAEAREAAADRARGNIPAH
ncbi:MAG: 4Fe-4S binding protein [Geminicoccaceae bacterium]